MLDQVTDAFKQKDYRTAARLLKQLAKEDPNNPWVRLYIGRLHEATGKLDAAETAYRKLLKNTTHPKVMTQARQGLGRLEAMEQEKRRQALAQATADPENTQFGVLVLEPIEPEAKPIAAQTLAKIMQIDPYTARLQLPTRGWRLYRVGPIGELKFYASSLQQGSVPCFWAILAEIQSLNVFRVHYFSQLSAEDVTVVCENDQGQLGSLPFQWSQVSQRVEGRLPIFEQVVDLDARGKLQRKTQTQDYAQFCDLHLPTRKTILRLCDRDYQFQQGIELSPQPQNHPTPGESPSSLSQTTNRINWNKLRDFLNRQRPQTPVFSDFTNFAETALDYKEMLTRLPAHIDLFRRQESLWDSAFELYSGLVFMKNN